MTDSQPQQDPGASSTPSGQSPDYDASGAAARTSSNPPPDTNQAASEDLPTQEAEAAPGTGSMASGNPQAPGALKARTATEGGPEEHQHGGDPGTGNAHGVSVASTDTIGGSSEDQEPVSGDAGAAETRTASDQPAGTARPGRSAAPDGEVSST